jgi:hypothetical protein
VYGWMLIFNILQVKLGTYISIYSCIICVHIYLSFRASFISSPKGHAKDRAGPGKECVVGVHFFILLD